MSDIVSRPSTPEYRAGWERIFGEEQHVSSLSSLDKMMNEAWRQAQPTYRDTLSKLKELHGKYDPLFQNALATQGRDR